MCDAFLETEILRFEINSSPRLPVFYFFTFLPFYTLSLSLATVCSSLAAFRQKCLKSSDVAS